MIKISILTDKHQFGEKINNIIEKNNDFVLNDSKSYTDVLIAYGKVKPVHCNTNILIISDGTDAEGIDAAIAVSCGISDCDTITISSSDAGKEMASLQREVISVYGNVIEPCEIDLSCIAGTIEEKILIGAFKLIAEID